MDDGTSRRHTPVRGLIAAVLFVVGTLAGLLAAYVLTINVTAMVNGDGGEWGQALIVVGLSVALGGMALIARARLIK